MAGRSQRRAATAGHRHRAPSPRPGRAGRGAEATGRGAETDCAVYVDGRRLPGERHHAEALAAARRAGGFVWLGLHEPDLTEMTEVAATFGLHELAVEDAVKARQRPKLERFGEVSFLALRTARYCEHAELTETSEVVETGQVMLFVGPHFVISVRHGDVCRLDPVRAEVEARPERLRHGPWAVVHAVADRVVDLYLEVADRMADDLEVLETDVLAPPSRPSASDRRGAGGIQRIYQMKRELVEFKRAVLPLQRPLLALVGHAGIEPRDVRGAGDGDAVPAEIRRYLQDVQDHLSRTVEQVNTYDDLLNSILQARLAQVTVDQNNDMRKIAAWAAVIAVWTAIAGVYGMNFTHMPELGTRYGYPVVLAVMLGISLALYRWFRRNGWL
ncbi:magnesium and cobalt transport protein CorA [Micromonospora fluostatini]|uniref:Magnesium and cobalt transport protein CorA n=1 Tax=Micromonospora fluostatini TaxID=1629071 RepID=A0ABY2DDJ3_9ACTN|nr:magnesium and cobalt transport protein CorA [Micromonospora fluostatini]